jgi:peptide/nickel transport system substrate-binding protein
MDSLVFEQRQAAYSDTAAGRYNVPWISLVMDRDARLVKNTILGFQRSGSVPESVFDIGGESLTSQGEADARYQAVLDWFSEYGLLVISNGPFKLTRYDPPAQFAELQAYRDPSYPFEPGDWRFGVPELVEIAQVPSGAIQIGAENALGVTLEGPGSLGVRYVLFDPADGTVIASGAATEGVAGEFTVELGEDVGDALQPGLYQLFLTAYSDAVSAVTERRIDLEASVAAPAPQVEATATPASGLVATPTPTTPDEQPTVVATAEAEEENGGGCGRGVATEIALPQAALALVGLVWRRRGVGR